MTPTEAVTVATDQYTRQIAELKAENTDLVAALVAEIDQVGLDEVSTFFYDITDDVKGDIGANAANELEDSADQDEAIYDAESWVSENISNAGTEQNVLCAIWKKGAEQAAADIRSEIAGLTTRPAA